MKHYMWLKPEIVAEIKFTEWSTRILRHAEFVDLRNRTVKFDFGSA